MKPDVEVDHRGRDDLTGPDAAWPSAKGLELDEDSAMMDEWCEGSKKDQVENLVSHF
jgi:hypothetical protein